MGTYKIFGSESLCVSFKSWFTIVSDGESISITNKEVIIAMICLCEVEVIKMIGDVMGCS